MNKQSKQDKSGQKTTPIEIEKYLKGVNFPANKDDLIECAENNNAPEEVQSILDQFEEREYRSVTEIAKEASEIEEN